MLKFLGQMLKFPVAAFATGVEVIARAMRDFQKAFEHTVETVTCGAGDTIHDPRPAEAEAVVPDSTNMEGVRMPDQDLSGDDLKYVSYSIVFTKPDYEATLESQRHQVVNYATNGGSYGGIKIAHFMGKISPGGAGAPRPQEWIDNPNPYPPANFVVDATHWRIPQEDEKYVTFIYEIEQRLPKETSDYDKRQTRALESISNKL